jgi:hypothetical protein
MGHSQLTMELHKLLETVNSKQSFLAFVDALRQDRIDELKKEEIKKQVHTDPEQMGGRMEQSNRF